MKNSEMKVSELLQSKRDIESKIGSLEKARLSASHEGNNSRHWFEDGGSVDIYSQYSTWRFCADRDLIVELLDKQIERHKAELDPITKKLEAIELMLNS